MLVRALVRNGLPEDLAKQYAQQALANVGKGKVVGTLAKVMMRLRGMRSQPEDPDKPKNGGAKKSSR